MTASVTGSDGNTVTYLNDTDRSLVTSVTDPASNTTTNSYDVMRRPTVTQIGSSALTNTYADDLLVGLSHTNDTGVSTQYTLSYTTADLLSSVQVGSNRTLVQNSYTPGTWTLAQQSYGNGAAWAYTYNEFDQVTVRRTTNGSAGAEFRYFYNSEGALARVEQYATTLSDGEVTGRTLLSTQRYYYDSVNRLTHVRETDADGAVHAFLWSYDSNNNVTQLTETVNGKTFTYANAYNADQQPTQSGYGSVSKTFTYDGLGRLSQTALTSGNSTVLTTGFGYKDRDTTRTTPQVETLQNAFGNSQESFTYTYDAKGNILSVSDGTDTTTYVYDALNELTWEKNAKAQTAWQYTYDLGGNILSKTAYNYQNGTVGSQTGSVSYTYGDGNWPDLLTAYDGNTITCDEIGNPLSYRGWTFTWQGGRQLASASDGTTSLSFAYNESGLRIRKTVGTAEHRCVYRGGALAAELTDAYALYFHHDVKGSPVGFTYAAGNTETEYFYRKNLQGDIIGIVDASGVSVAEYSYDAWGRPLSTPTPGTLAAINPLRYRGYYYDSECALYYLHSRYYDPETCRFINADAFVSTGQGILGSNMFVCCGNNPVTNTDSSGRMWYYFVEESETTIVEQKDDGSVVYMTRIKYSAIAPSASLLLEDSTFYGTVEIKYTIDNQGVIELDTQQNTGGILGDIAITEELAKEMLNVAKIQVPGALSGRTPFGLGREIRIHFRSSAAIPFSSIRFADMGGVTNPGYDYNARGFENLWKMPSVIFEMFEKRVLPTLLKSFIAFC